MLSTYSSSRREDIAISNGGARKVKDGLIPRREKCQFFGLKLENNTNSAPLQALSICLGIGQLRLTTYRLELSANGNQLRLISI